MDTTQKVFAGGALLTSLVIGFKAEFLNWFKNELTVWRFLFVCSIVAWAFWAVRRFVVLPIHKKIDNLAKQQADYTLNFNREQHAHIKLEKRVAALDGITE
jgi:hypothetical protein